VDLKGLENKSTPFAAFSIKKTAENSYKVNFGADDFQSGQFNLNADTVFLEINSNHHPLKIPFFVRNHFNETKDTFNFPNDRKIFIARKPGISIHDMAIAEITFLSRISREKFELYFSFDLGFVQIAREDNVCRELVILQPEFKYFNFPLGNGVGYL